MPVGFWLVLNGLERSAGLKPARAVPLAVFFANLVSAIVFTYAVESYAARAVVFSAANAILSFHAAALLASTVRSLSGFRRALRVAGAAALAGNALAALARVVIVLAGSDTAPRGLAAASAAETVAIMVGLALFTVFGFLVVQSINERIAGDLRAAAEDRALLLREMHHRVENDLSLVESMARLQESALGTGPAATTFAEFADRVRSIALVHDRLSRKMADGAMNAAPTSSSSPANSARHRARRGVRRPARSRLETGLGLALLGGFPGRGEGSERVARIDW